MKQGVEWLMVAVQRATVGSPRSLRDGEVRRVLLLSTTALGDTVVSTAAVEAALAMFPAAEIHFLVPQAFFPMFRRLAAPRLAILGIERGWRGVFSILPQLRAARFDTAILLHGNEPQSTALCVLAGIPRIVKLAKEPLMARLWSTRNAWHFPDMKHHLVEKRLDMLRLFQPLPEGKFRPHLTLQSASQPAAAEWLEQRGFAPAAPVVGIQICASEPHREWPAGNWVEFIRGLLARQPAVGVVLTGSAREGARLEDIRAAVGSPRVAVNAGEVGMAIFPEFLSNLALLITGDTGTMHVAAACGVPMVCLFGASNPAVTGPYPLDERAICLSPRNAVGDYAGMAAITVDALTAATLEQLGRRQEVA